MKELLDIVDELGNPTGKVVEREIAHQKGIRHRTSHVWLVRKRNNKVQVLLQKRSHNKDSFPDCYDISSAGHIPAGQDYAESALRELYEELGYRAKSEDLIYCGKRSFRLDENFHHREFHDFQVSAIYMIWLDLQETDFRLQKEEVSSVKWLDLDECMQAVKNNTIKHCIYLDELEIIYKRIIDIHTAK